MIMFMYIFTLVKVVYLCAALILFFNNFFQTIDEAAEETPKEGTRDGNPSEWRKCCREG